MGYHGWTDCIFCYTNKRVNTPVQREYSTCFKCFETRVGEYTENFNVQNTINDFLINFNHDCGFCHMQKQMLFKRVPVCESCVGH